MFKWEGEEERLLKLMSISPKKKLEWLRQMNEFLSRGLSGRALEIRKILRKGR